MGASPPVKARTRCARRLPSSGARAAETLEGALHLPYALTVTPSLFCAHAASVSPLIVIPLSRGQTAHLHGLIRSLEPI